MPAVPSQFSGGSGTPDLIAILQALLAQSGAGQMTGMGASGRPQANSSPFPNIPAINTPQIPFMPAMSGNIPGLSGQGGGGSAPSGGGGGKGGGKGSKGGGKGGGIGGMGALGVPSAVTQGAGLITELGGLGAPF